MRPQSLREAESTRVRFCNWILVSVFLIGGLAGCSRNSAARKQKYLESGAEYFAKQKYREAEIEYQNALQIDPYFTAAHYGLAQVFLKQGDWSRAYHELTLTVSSEPTNTKAQLDLGNLLLVAGKYQDARDHAQSVLQIEPQNPKAQLLLADWTPVLAMLRRRWTRLKKRWAWTPIAPSPT